MLEARKLQAQENVMVLNGKQDQKRFPEKRTD
jgi:hypothetical protein